MSGDPERFKDLNEPAHYAVGEEFGRVIVRWEMEHGRDPGVETGRTMRPARAQRIPTCTGPDQAARIRVSASCCQSSSSALA